MPQTLTTIQGDTWDRLAKCAYGNELLMDVLLAANTEHLNTAIFSAGVQIAVPETEQTVRSALPPWRAE